MKLLSHLIVWCAIALAVLSILTSCDPQRKLHKALDEIAKHPIESAKYCADKYPVIPIIDSSLYLESKRKIDSITSILDTSKIITERERAELILEIERLKSIRPDCDSICDPVYRLAAKEADRANKIEANYKALLFELKNIKPIIKTEKDSALTEFYRLKYIDSESKYQELFKKYHEAVEQGFEYKKQRNKMRLWFWILVGAISGYTFLRVRKLIPF